MRTFIAIDVSDQIREALGRVEAHLKYAGADVKWVKPENIHLTLKFLGEIDEKKAGAVKSALDSIACSTRSFELTIKDIGAFPKIDHPRVIWVGLDKGAAETVTIAAKVDEAMGRLGFAKEERPFSPHLTIGRVRSPLNKAKLADKISSAASAVTLSGIVPYRVSSLVLFRSTLTPQGSVYSKLHESDLQ